LWLPRWLLQLSATLSVSLALELVLSPPCLVLFVLGHHGVSTAAATLAAMARFVVVIAIVRLLVATAAVVAAVAVDVAVGVAAGVAVIVNGNVTVAVPVQIQQVFRTPARLVKDEFDHRRVFGRRGRGS